MKSLTVGCEPSFHTKSLYIDPISHLLKVTAISLTIAGFSVQSIVASWLMIDPSEWDFHSGTAPVEQVTQSCGKVKIHVDFKYNKMPLTCRSIASIVPVITLHIQLKIGQWI